MKKKFLSVPIIAIGILMILSYYRDPMFAINHVLGAWPIAFSFLGIDRLKKKKGNKFVSILIILMSLALSAVGFIEGVKYTLVPILAVILIAFGILFFFNNDKDSHSNELEGQEFDFDKGERDELYKEKWEKAIDNSNWDFSKNEFKEILDLEDEKEYVESEKTNSEEKAKVQEDSRKKLIPDNILDDLNVALGDLSEKAKELGKNINDSNLKNKNLTKSRKKQGIRIFKQWLPY